MPIRTVGEYLNRWGFTRQRPLKKAYKQNPKAVESWLKEDYPNIVNKAKIEKAEIHWGDETGLCNDSYHGRSYALRGETPAIKFHPRCKRVNLISTATNQGKVRFMVYKDKMNSQALIKFMTRLIKDSDKKIYLILDNLKVHHNHMVKDWVNEHEDESELFFLPSYSPELNPDEYLNCDLKVGVHSQAPSRTADELKCNSISHLKKLQKLPDALKITSNTRGLLKQLVVAVFNWRFNIIAEGGFNHNCSVDTANDSGRCHPNFMQGLFDL